MMRTPSSLSRYGSSTLTGVSGFNAMKSLTFFSRAASMASPISSRVSAWSTTVSISSGASLSLWMGSTAITWNWYLGPFGSVMGKSRDDAPTSFPSIRSSMMFPANSLTLSSISSSPAWSDAIIAGSTSFFRATISGSRVIGFVINLVRSPQPFCLPHNSIVSINSDIVVCVYSMKNVSAQHILL